MKDNAVYLHHILDAIDQLEEYTQGMSENEFLSHSMAQDAVVRQIEIIGEAARNVSEMIGIRNKIIHEYFNINFAIVWDTIQGDLPALKKTIKKVLK